jgi:hypothetical protein
VDARVQGAFLFRIVLYWFLGLLAITELVMCWNILNGPGGPFLELLRFDVLWADYAPEVVVSLLILAVVLVDTISLTNRMAGPLFRIRRSMAELAAGEKVAPLQFRDKDFWQEVAQEFNAVSAYVEQLKQQLAAASAEQKPTAKKQQNETIEPQIKLEEANAF